jgi:hypothetical protein
MKRKLRKRSPEAGVSTQYRRSRKDYTAFPAFHAETGHALTEFREGGAFFVATLTHGLATS